MGLVKTCVDVSLVLGVVSLMKALRYPQLVGVRLCLGIAESGLAAGVFY